jgi:tetratricopeptide (TPR) repeat protein
MKKSISNIFMVIVTVMIFSSCESYLDAKPDQALATPSTLKDLEAIENSSFVNGLYPNAGDIMSDDYYMEDAVYKSLTDVTARENYLFGGNTYQDFDWSNLYNGIFRANVPLDEIKKINYAPSEQGRVDMIKGSALFTRAMGNYHLIQIFALPYQKETASETLGIPLKLSSDLNEKIFRSNLEDCYQVIIQDLTQAIALLPNRREFKTQPSKAAAYGLLGKVYLVMGDYEKALDNATQSLAISNSLMDYNSLKPNDLNPIVLFNSEVLYNAVSTGRGNIFYGPTAKVNMDIYNSYVANDLRKTVFFSKNTNGSYSFKGDYAGRNYGSLFAGITVDETMLIKAECEVRLNRVNEGLKSLNDLLRTRWKTGTYVDMTAVDQAAALKLVLLERRKELVFRCNVRWSDIKRFANDVNHAVSLKRTVEGKDYELKSGDLRFAGLIPLITIQLSGVVQNGR